MNLGRFFATMFSRTHRSFCFHCRQVTESRTLGQVEASEKTPSTRIIGRCEACATTTSTFIAG